MPRSVVVLDYGSGNLRSAHRALERAGASVVVTADRDAALAADGLVVPGVGAFAACMAGLVAVGGDDVIRDRVQAGRAVLGICVGMQILFDYGVEHGARTGGVGLLPGGIEHLHAPVLPHMGWNTVVTARGSRLFDGVTGQRFYFVHSYGARDSAALRRGRCITTASHGEQFAAGVEAGPLSATQFHPEKSGQAGARLLANWVGNLA